MSEEYNSECPIRIKLALSLLSGKPVKIKNIRKYEEEPSLKGNIPKV